MEAEHFRRWAFMAADGLDDRRPVMRVDRLIVSPSRDAKDVVEAAIIRPEHGLAAVVYAQASAAPDHVVIDAAKRGAAAWKPGTGGGSPLRAVLRPWIARIASAVRQAGEACEIGGLGAAREAGQLSQCRDRRD